MLAFVLDVLGRACMLTLALYMWALGLLLLWSVVDDARRMHDGRPTLGEELREQRSRR